MSGEIQNGGNMNFQPMGSPFAHLGPEAATAYNPNAPIDEVEDASSRLMKIYGSTSGSSQPINPELAEVCRHFAMLQQSERHAGALVAKAEAAREGRMVYGDRLSPEGKAVTTAWATDFGRGAFKWLPKRGIQLPVLRAFARRLEVAQAIIRTRKRTVDRFSRPSRAIDDIGWRLVMEDENANSSADIQADIKWLTKVLECGGREFGAPKRRELKRQGMTQFLRNLTEDALVLDGAATELVGLDRILHGLDSWYVRPSETFALASPAYGDHLPDGRLIYAFQVLNGRAEIPFGYDELAIFTRNSSTWAEENGYGYSEFEQSLDTLNNFIQAMTFTKQGLNENAVPRGILMAYGNYDINTQNAFKAAWAAKVRGVQNQFSTPVLFSRGQQGGVQYLNTGAPFEEMAFAKWISLNMTLMCAIFGVAAEEVGFQGFSDEKSSLSGDDTGEKLAAAKDKGLHPLLKDESSFISEEIVARFGLGLKLEFTGLDVENTKERWAEKIKHMTINEVRALFDQGPHPTEWIGNLPADKGEQDSEFQRMQAAGTWGEIRKVWGGFEEYPSPILQVAPVNASLGALFQQVLSVPSKDGGLPEEGEEEGGEPGNPALGDTLASRLQEIQGQSAPTASLEDMQAKAGVGPEGE